jgi:predicted RNA-binding protein YlqC (UPF0109 family)
VEVHAVKELLEVIAKSLVDEPSAVSVSEKEGEHAVILELRVADGDMGKVIGKQGRIAKSIRTVMKAAANHENKKVVVEIVQ